MKNLAYLAALAETILYVARKSANGETAFPCRMEGAKNEPEKAVSKSTLYELEARAKAAKFAMLDTVAPGSDAEAVIWTIYKAALDSIACHVDAILAYRDIVMQEATQAAKRKTWLNVRRAAKETAYNEAVKSAAIAKWAMEREQMRVAYHWDEDEQEDVTDTPEAEARAYAFRRAYVRAEKAVIALRDELEPNNRKYHVWQQIDDELHYNNDTLFQAVNTYKRIMRQLEKAKRRMEMQEWDAQLAEILDCMDNAWMSTKARYSQI